MKTPATMALQSNTLWVKNNSLLTWTMVLFALLFGFAAQGQVEIREDGSSAPARVGREAARDYFVDRQRPAARPIDRQPAAAGGAPRYLGLHIGTYIDDKAYKWAVPFSEDVGKLNAGVSYRVGEWVNSMDLLFRADFTSYELATGRALKMSLLPLVTFPDVSSGFPLYFGAGAGLGIFFKQVSKESVLSLDYQLLAGARFFNIIDNIGFNIEAGIKNHMHLLSDGQFNGIFLTVGTVFNF